MIEHLDEIRLEGVGFEYYVFFWIAFVYSVFYNLVEFHSFGLKFFDIQVGSNDDLVFFKHFNHIVGDAEKCGEWFLECVETAFQAFHHVNAIDSGECLSNMFGVFIFALIFWFQKFYGAITGVVEAFAIGVAFWLSVGELFQCLVETLARIGIHLINQLIRRQYVWKFKALFFNIFLIIFVIHDIMTCSSDCDLIDDFISYLRINLIDIIGDISFVTLLHEFLILLD